MEEHYLSAKSSLSGTGVIISSWADDGQDTGWSLQQPEEGLWPHPRTGSRRPVQRQRHGEGRAVMCSEEDLTSLGRCDHGTMEMQASGLHLVLSEGSLLLAALTPALG